MMDNRKESSGELIFPSASSRERMLLRKLIENYYGLYLVRLIKGIIHNLNGPLQILYIRSEQLEQSLSQLRGVLQSETLSEAEGLVGRMEERIKSLSTSLYDLNTQLSHLTSDLVIERHSEVGDVKINQVVESCLYLLNANMFFKHNVKKKIRLDDGLPILKGRKTDFSLIILNLVQNALEAMVDAQDKHLTLETASKEDKVVIRVEDTGCGVPEEHREYIYETFFTTKKGAEYEGKLDKHVGLGLSLVCLLLEDYNGTIAHQSVPGKTTFTVEIPCLVNLSDG
ncbi:MAG: GHKL domain-containing protein [Deltaproteobacteria bacterium]|nr:GHKL domain-containing protein [Deltaproteobacteria bacterium]MBW2018935.1 GHKL domain-containing protein [Deltaproteobacteria bacterium]MBW2073150.1 GHKL domain-containing protein [Deltaproteobacteria bacterium]RLB83769.1 MAG: hypothetical protein DRH17_01025 [Deltaproteobacteria bacterium]